MLSALPDPEFAELIVDEDGVPRSPRFGDRYYSRSGGLEEARHVFLEGNRLSARWQADESTRRRSFTVGELGFGSGLNFLATWQLWRQTVAADRHMRLNYLAIERYPLRCSDLQRVHAAWPELAELSTALLACWPAAVLGTQRLLLADGTVQLTLIGDEVSPALARLDAATMVDAWLLDGFSPPRNPQMWSAAVCEAMAAHSPIGGTVASYSVARLVRENLQRSGFTNARRPGYGPKRHSLCGHLSRSARAGPALVHAGQRPRKALVLGAGLAGCHVAAALAVRGVEVTVIEAAEDAASGASGQPRSMIFPWLAGSDTLRGRLSLAGYQFAVQHYRRLMTTGRLRAGVEIDCCGLLQLGVTPKLQQRLQAVAEYHRNCSELLVAVSAAAAAEISGIAQRFGGLHYPDGGWLQPWAVCRALLASPGVTLRKACSVVELVSAQRGWKALDESGLVVAEAEVAVVATGSAPLPRPLAGLPLSVLGGQSSWLENWAPTRPLRCVLSHRGYLCPADPSGRQLFGATHQPEEEAERLPAQHDADNLRLLLRALAPPEGAAAPALSSARSGRRCQSPDGLPLVGLSRPGLYLSLAHGGRGVCHTPICGLLLADLICGEPLPLDRQTVAALSPQRFARQNMA